MASKIINLRYAKKGTGTTAMEGARRARLVPNLDVKTAHSDAPDLLGGSWRAGAAPQVIIETENLAEVMNFIAGSLTSQVLRLGYSTPEGNKYREVKYCTATAAGPSEFPPAEGSGDVPLYQITFDVHQGDGVTTLALAFPAAQADT